MAGNQRGMAGCGCLVFLVVIFVIGAGVLMHPYSLRFLGSRLYYSDRIVPGDLIFVPRFSEDKNGELYVDAFREYWAGNGKSIWVEDEKILGVSVREFVTRMAKERGIKEEAIKKIEAEGEDGERALKKRVAAFNGKVIVIVPDYASRRYHLLCDSLKGSQRTVFLIKAVNVSYFKKDKWWRDEQSRYLMAGEIYDIVRLYMDRFKHGDKEDRRKE